MQSKWQIQQHKSFKNMHKNICNNSKNPRLRDTKLYTHIRFNGWNLTWIDVFSFFIHFFLNLLCFGMMIRKKPTTIDEKKKPIEWWKKNWNTHQQSTWKLYNFHCMWMMKSRWKLHSYRYCVIRHDHIYNLMVI